MAANYPKKPYEIGFGSAALYPGRTMDHTVVVKADLPCTTIVIHGVNDVGVSYGAVESGLCLGMSKRLKLPDGAFVPNNYRDFKPEDREKLEDDPGAVFFKRIPTPNAHSFVIPFYWGYRENDAEYDVESNKKNTQFVDRYGNRLDKDFSKEGGPFANATNSLPDMWNKGISAVFGIADKQVHDPERPVMDAPGHMYMVLAAQRMAALIQMIRDYDADETVNIVAHSQGCMVSLLAQAFLLQDGRKPADTLIMNNPPYSLEDELPFLMKIGKLFTGGTDARMVKDGNYDALGGIQTLNARIQTLVNIVQGVGANKHQTPVFQALQASGGCTVGAKWSPGADRDNRGKIYLYFSPEDATVALSVMRGIGWQGVPDEMTGGKTVDGGAQRAINGVEWDAKVKEAEFKPLSMLGTHFFQRVFTRRLRVPPSNHFGGTPVHVLVGAPAPYDFALRIAGEEDFAHVNEDIQGNRGSNPPVQWPFQGKDRAGVRTITGEALPVPVKADLDSGAIGKEKKDDASDAIDAAIALTSQFGMEYAWRMIPDQSGAINDRVHPTYSPCQLWDDGVIRLYDYDKEAYDVINAARENEGDMEQVLEVYQCLETHFFGPSRPAGQLLVKYQLSPNVMRLKWQHAPSSRSFHSAIFCSAFNHENVTAYDLSIGQGKAVSDPNFRAYLCAVADWRLKQPAKKQKIRSSILTWKKFLEQFSCYYDCEPQERQDLIFGTSTYYSSGVLPDFLPVAPGGIPPTVVCETNRGIRVDPSKGRPVPLPAKSESQTCEKGSK